MRLIQRELLEMIEDIMGKEVAPVHGPSRKGDIKHSYADISAAEADLGYTADVTIQEGLKATIDWFKDF